ncbi:MAG: hypothetical protein JW913_05030 [Chitinispirillaceae bacterium]|nr:hypothetical protein [Chitinispirillaceae bacterium]
MSGGKSGEVFRPGRTGDDASPIADITGGLVRIHPPRWPVLLHDCKHMNQRVVRSARGCDNYNMLLRES